MEDFIWEKEIRELIKKSWIAKPHERCALPNYISTLNTVLQEHYEPPHQGTTIANEGTAQKIYRNQLKVDKTLLGAGSCGTVYEAYHPAFEIVAYKELQYHKRLAEELQGMREAVIMEAEHVKDEKRELMYTNKLNNHPNILKFLAYVVDDDNGKCTGMILEYMAQGTVARAIFTPGILHIERIKGWFLQLAQALQYCNELSIETALLCDNWCTLKLCDFGSATNVVPYMTGIPKSLCCAAPETINRNKYDYKCDVYSFAMFIYTVTYKTLPFMEKVEQVVINDQSEKEITSIWSSIKVSYKTLDNKLVSSDTQTTLLKDDNFSRTFLLQHNDDKEDEFRPTIDLEAMFDTFTTGKGDRFSYLAQDDLHLRMMVWLMKECWRTKSEARPTIKQVVDLLDFHFKPPLSFHKGDKGEILLKNTSFYPVWFNLCPAQVYEIEEGEEKTKMVRAHERRVENGLLEPKTEYTLQDRKDIAFAKDWTQGLVTFVINFPMVPLDNRYIESK